jgi:hypothetical protein
MVKLVELVVDPTGVVTFRRPLVAVPGTVVLICESEATVKDAATPLNVTLVAPVNPEPFMVTLLPTGPLVGLKELITGGPITVKLLVLLPVPAAVVTLIGPVVALEGTLVVI